MAAGPTPLDMDTLSPIMPATPSYSRAAAAEPSSRRSSASSAPSAALRPSLTRRTSLEEDYFYRSVFTVERNPNEPPPSYETTIKKIRRKEERAAAAAAEQRKTADLDKIRKQAAAVTARTASSNAKGKGKGKSKEKAAVDSLVHEIQSPAPEDVLPPYSCDLHIEGVFQKKMEIQNTTKRAEDRRWNTEYLVLHGTALEVYECRKDRSWAGRTAKTGPACSPDRPPWMRKAALEKSYSLMYADVGIAADYVKRRYVIRIRVETDQFLISCVELETFVQWLDALFAAISIAAPIDERDFPRDQSIPRMQRVRWFNGRAREAEATVVGQETEHESENRDEVAAEVAQVTPAQDDDAAPPPRLVRLASASSHVSEASVASVAASSSSSGSSEAAAAAAAAAAAGPSTQVSLHHASTPHQQAAAARAVRAPQSAPSIVSGKSSLGVRRGARFTLRTITSRLAQKHQQTTVALKNTKNNDSSSEDDGNGNGGPSHGSHGPALAIAGVGARSGFSPPNHDFVDAATGKWQPSHRWTTTHDMVYAKLCYATLLFRSPRKSNYIIVRGKQWLVDWKTGNMARVSPPWYNEIDCQPGPFQMLRMENSRI